MDVLNTNGLNLLNYRQYYFRQPEMSPVRKKISTAIHDLYAQKRIPETIFKEILDTAVADSQFITDLQKYPQFRKPSEELSNQFDAVRASVNDYLVRLNLVENISTKNMVLQNTIAVIHTFDISKDVLIGYFGLSVEELSVLMKRKGFMEKFCALRLSRVFQCIYTSVTVPSNIRHRYSKVYYNPVTQCFSIDYEFLMDIGYIRNTNNMRTLLNRIQQIDKQIVEKFRSMVGSEYFAANSLRPSSVLESDIVGLEVPLRTGKKSQEIKNVRFFVDDVVDANDGDKSNSDTAEPHPEAEAAKEPTDAKAAPASTSESAEDETPLFTFSGFDDEPEDNDAAPEAPVKTSDKQAKKSSDGDRDVQTKTGRQVAEESAGNRPAKKKQAGNKPV